MKDLCFVDSETTSLSAEDGLIWEWAGIRRSAETGEETTMLMQIEVDLGKADPFSLNIGKYYERFGENGEWEPQDLYVDDIHVATYNEIPTKGEVVSDPFTAAKLIADFTRGTHLVGNCISFDAERMERFLRAWEQCPGWHYHIIDIEPIIVGYMRALQKYNEDADVDLSLPYKSSALSAYIGVSEPSDEERHTAMGDAEWVKRQWDAVFS